MAQKFFNKMFEVFRGLDLSVSFLKRMPEAAVTFQNTDISDDGSVQTRKGYKVVTGEEPAAGAGPKYGIKTYRYADSSGETQEELIGFGNSMYKLQTGTMQVTGPANSTFSFLVDTSTSNWVADCQVSGVTVGGSFPYNCGTGVEDVPVKLATLADAIDALSGWTCTLTPRAIVNGLQNSRDAANAITVDSGHTCTNISTTAPTRLPAVTGTVSPDLYFYDLIAQTATTVTLAPDDPAGSFDVEDDAEIGIGVYAAACLPITNSQDVSSAVDFTIEYWEQIYTHYYRRDSMALPGIFAVDGHNYVGKNLQNVLYVGSPFKLGRDNNNY